MDRPRMLRRANVQPPCTESIRILYNEIKKAESENNPIRAAQLSSELILIKKSLEKAGYR